MPTYTLFSKANWPAKLSVDVDDRVSVRESFAVTTVPSASPGPVTFCPTWILALAKARVMLLELDPTVALANNVSSLLWAKYTF